MILPSALRRIEQTQPAGYVVAILDPGRDKPRHLTNADVTDLEGAETEAASWRKRPVTPGASRSRYVVCAVVPAGQREGEM